MYNFEKCADKISKKLELRQMYSQIFQKNRKFGKKPTNFLKNRK